MNQMKPMAINENQRISPDALISALKRRDSSLNGLAKDLGVSSSSFHRWVHTDKAIPRNLIWEIGMKLDLDKEEMDTLLMVPKYRTFFGGDTWARYPKRREKMRSN